MENEDIREGGYTPRPLWQRICAWVGLAIVITGVVLYYLFIAGGGIL